ncbi:MAG TPA: trypsin-like peptidase domain-containing protein [Thermoanaerobaculia bacterium]|nr:trypsin-like peptidase domain-containing protein [Thermoanaerobaculia bacterium]
MLSVPRWAVAAAALLLTFWTPACRREPSALDEVQRMAYRVRPAVVRVRAYATARFIAPAADLTAIHDEIVRRGLARPVPRITESTTVDTGAGGSGSGFIVHPDGVILTSGHVVGLIRDPAAVQAELRRNGAVAILLARYSVDSLRTLHRNAVLIPLVDQLAAAGSLRDIRTFREIDLSNGDRAAFTIAEYSPSLGERGNDLAVLRIERHDLPTVPLGDSGAVHVQDPIWVIGYPAVASSSDEMIGGWLSQETDLEPTVNSGRITAIKRNVADVPVFQTDVPVYRGNSGGPAVSRHGEVIGLAAWGHATADAIKFLVPANVARPYLARQNVSTGEQGSFTASYAAAIEATARGSWRAALRDLRRAQEAFPGNPDVARLTRDAEAALRATPFWRDSAFAGTAAIGLALLGGVVLLGWRKRRRPAPTLTVPTGAGSPETTVVVPLREPRSDGVLGKLTILNGARAGERLGLAGSGIRIGRESMLCEIVLEDPKVSRLHAEVVRLDGRVLLIDRNSSNGTWVNDEKIQRRYLKDGDIIYFGGRNAVAVAFHD